MLPGEDFGRGAIFDEQRLYRYRLFREWREGRGVCCFVMLNPSTADEELSDPTVRRCIDYAHRWGFRRLEVVNLFALRSTDAKVMSKHLAPIGLDNDYWIEEVCGGAAQVIAAWGSHSFMKGMLQRRAREVQALLARLKVEPRCLGKNKDGQPVHPLYQPKDAQLVPL